MNKEQIAKQVLKEIKNLAKVSKIAYFPKKIVLTGQSHISRKNQLTKLARKLSRQYNWEIALKFIYIDGNINEYLIDKVIESFPQRYDIEKLNIDLKNKKLLIHCYYEQNIPKITLDMLKKIENEFNINITLIDLETAKSSKLGDLIIQTESPSSEQEENLIELKSEDLVNNILSLLPKWVDGPEVKIPKSLQKDNSTPIILEVRNDFTDIERIQFLEMLLENQIGFPVKIEQKYDINPQIEIAENAISLFINEFTSELSSDDKELKVKYESFPLDIKDEKELTEKILKSSKFKLVLENKYDPQPMNLALKERILGLVPELDYSYIFFDKEKRTFNVLIPEEYSSEINYERVGTILEKEYQVKIIFSNIEDNPIIYLSERILADLIDSKKIKKINFDNENNIIDIIGKDPLIDLGEEVWKKILFRFSKFKVRFFDSNRKKYQLSDFPYYQNLEEPELIDLLLKVLPGDLDVKSVVWYERSGYYLVKFNNLLLSADFLGKVTQNIQKTWNINIFFQSARRSDELISTMKENIPDWILQPKVTADEKSITLTVENDYTDENKLEEFCNRFSQKLLVPVSIQFHLSVSRIKHIVVNNLREHVDITRIKVYPEKNQIYLEGVLRRYIDDDTIQEALDNIEERTKFIVEAYIKPNKAIKGETVHDILNRLNESYELTNTFSEDIIDEISKIKDADIQKELENRLDLRDWDCISIDTSGTRIIDDLISIQRLTHENKEDEYLLGVHIADVDYFIPSASKLDNLIGTRGMSMYIGEFYPMIPDELTQKISLDEGKDRLTVSMLIEISLDGEIVDFWIKKTMVRNKKQFSFDQVNEQLMEYEGKYLNDLQILVSLTYQLRHQRIERGSFNLDIDFVLDNQASQIVTEIMILANRLMGFYMQNSPGQKVFRNQHIPSYAYVNLAQTLELYGYKLDLLNKNPLTQLNQILSEASQKNEQQLIFKELRRYLSNAYYSHNCYGYESLGTHYYTHFTSPMRRYVDLLVARLAFNSDLYIDNLTGTLQYLSALERFSKIKVDNYSIQQQQRKINSIKDKPIESELYGFNRKQVVFLLKDLNAYATIRLANNPGLILMENEEGVEFQGEFIHIGKEVLLQIVDVTQEKRDIFLSLGLLEKLQIDQKHNVRAKLMFLG